MSDPFDFDRLLDALVAAVDDYPRRELRDRFRALLQPSQLPSVTVSTITATEKPRNGNVPLSRPKAVDALKDVTFTPIGVGQQVQNKIPTGKTFIVHELSDGTVIKRPHDNGRPLTDEEIHETLARWNREAREIVRGSMPPDAA